MRPSIVVLTILAIQSAFATGGSAQGAFPYVAYVATEEAPLRSGPGEDYYETSHARHGEPLEVWRHAPGGWLAVRPPNGSFSLVSASDVRVRPDRVAEVVRADVPAQIGSEVQADRDVVQVLLAKGEQVHVLETITIDGGFWHKIAPPAGEFRWIHAAHIAGPTGMAENPPIEQVASDTADVAIAPEQAANSAGSSHSYRVARYSPAAGDALPPGNGPDVEPSATTEHAGPAVTLAEIELELATIVAEDSRLWRFAHLQRRCEELLESTKSQARHEEIQTVLEKIARFERIRDRSESLAQRREHLASAKAEPALRSRDLPQSSEREAIHTDERVAIGEESDTRWRASRTDVRRDDPQERRAESVVEASEVVRIPDQPDVARTPGRYDGVGTLRPVVSRRREAPRYALVDAEGDMTMFITPSPGVNLQPYLGQRIGVVGTRGYMPEFKRPHVTAARVTPLR